MPIVEHLDGPDAVTALNILCTEFHLILVATL